MAPVPCRAVPRVPPAALVASASWTQLERLAKGCTACPLHRTRRQVVMARGDQHPRVLFIGEAPGAAEDAAGLPFVGRAGRRLDEAAASLDLAPGTWAVVNLLKCRPPENRFRPASIAACRPFLDRQIELLDPEWIVTLGRHALRALDPGAPSITEAAGTERPFEGRRLFALLHPAAALHNPRLRARWAADLDRLRSALAAAPETL